MVPQKYALKVFVVFMKPSSFCEWDIVADFLQSIKSMGDNCGMEHERDLVGWIQIFWHYKVIYGNKGGGKRNKSMGSQIYLCFVVIL